MVKESKNETARGHLSDDPLSPEELNLQASLFYELFESTTERGCILLLLELAGQLGDRRDIPVVEPFRNHSDRKIRKLADAALTALNSSDA